MKSTESPTQWIAIMAFTIRVVLHGATRPQYDQLYAALAILGITDTITANDGRRYKLPDGEYNFEGQTTPEALRQSAAAAAAGVVPEYAVLVTVATGRYWQGLVYA